MNFNKCVVSVHSQHQHKPAPPLPPMPPPSSSLTPPNQPAPPPPPNTHQNLSSYSSSSSASSSASSTSSHLSNYLQPKTASSKQTSPIYNSSSCSFSTNNLSRLKFSNQQHVPFSSRTQQQQQQINNYSQRHFVAGSMRNISELLLMNTSIKTPPTTANASVHDKEDQNYTNLQQALRAATAALQKSKISTNMATSQPMSKSHVNLTAGALSFQPYTKQQPNAIHKRVYKNTLNLKIDSSHYDNIEDNIDISVNLAGDETAPKKQQPDTATAAAGNETISSFSSPSSSLSSSTKSTKLNTQKLTEFFVDSPDIYREIGVDCDYEEEEEDDDAVVMAEINIGPATSNYNFGVVSQKSASIDHLNLASCFAKPSSHTNNNNNPPPNIQPCSGVLSKSLHSLVLKPQPLKPVVELLQTGSNVTPLRRNQQQFLLKSKCASTTNLVQASTAPTAANGFIKPTKSVNFLAANSKLSESDDSLDIDETASSTSDSTASEASGQQVEILVDSRQALEERLNSLQVMYDELKANFEKDLERDVRAMRSRLAESREYSAKLAKALGRCKCQGKAGGDEELLKRSQAENCELRARLEAERRQFEAERGEWMAEKERVLQFQGYLAGKAGERSGQVQAKKSLASHMQFLQQKLSLSQQQSKKELLKPQHQFMPSKLFGPSMLAKSSRDVNSEKANSSSVSSCGASYASSQSHRIRQQQHNNFL